MRKIIIGLVCLVGIVLFADNKMHFMHEDVSIALFVVMISLIFPLTFIPRKNVGKGHTNSTDPWSLKNIVQGIVCLVILVVGINGKKNFMSEEANSYLLMGMLVLVILSVFISAKKTIKVDESSKEKDALK